MKLCPSCQTELEDPRPAACPTCGERLSAELPPAGHDTPQDLSGPGRTVVDDSGTVDERSISKTRTAPTEAESMDDTGTVDDRGFRTLDSVVFASPQAGATQINDGSGTFDSHQVAEQEAKALDKIWGSAAAENVSPNMTIRGDEPSDTEQRESSLVIQNRAFRDSVESADVGDYDLLEKLGEGGMGVVYMARQASIDRTVAVKMLKPRAAVDSAQKSKFLSEAVITGELEHPNIVPIYDLGKNNSGALFYAMKRVKGTPWEEVIKQKSITENIEILLKMCDAVGFAHSRGIIHRDLKPENTMLGDFGEVLVMDWGLALSVGKQSRSYAVVHKAGMGGTPAYMAPEMATGPFHDLGPSSDIYLLGATLFEIVTGRTPHHGRDVMKCLIAAARNDIVATKQEGELIDIARKAMSTDPKDRYATVAEFQRALRDYQEHSDSITMASRAQQELDEATESNDYESYAKSLFGFQEAVNLWEGNEKAEQGVGIAKLAYADSAYKKGDFDLGASLLDPDNPTHVQLKGKIVRAQRSRHARQRRLKLALRTVAALVVTVLATVSAALVVVHNQKTIAVQALAYADQQRELAENNRVRAEQSKQEALESATRAEEQKQIAENKEAEANRLRDTAIENEQLADKNAAEALRLSRVADESAREAEQQRDLAEKRRLAAEYEAYVALIGLAAAKIEENAFVDARELLNGEVCKPELRGWEWGRLMHLCNQMVLDFDPGARVEAVAFSPDNSRFASAGWDGMTAVWDTRSNEPLVEIRQGDTGQQGLEVLGLAFSPDGKLLATGSNDPAGFLRIWDAESGAPISPPLTGHSRAISSVEFSPSGRWLVSSSFDGQARIWDVSDPSQPASAMVLHGHTWWVWDAAFSPDESQLATASQDGSVLIWSLEDGTKRPPFLGHRGPVYSVAFTPDGESVVSGGADNQVLLWRTDALSTFDYRAVISGEEAATESFHRLSGHTAAVRSVDAVWWNDRTLIASSGHDNTVRLWDGQSRKLLQTMRGHGSWVRSCALSTDGRYVVSGAYDSHNPAKLWSIEGYAEVRVLRGQVLRGHFDAITSASFSPDGSRVVTSARDRTARVWNTQTGQSLLLLQEGHSFLVSAGTFFDGDKRLLTSAMDNTARVWDVTSGAELFALERTGRAAAAAASASGVWILTGSDANTAKLWNARNGTLVREYSGEHRHDVTAVDISADDRLVATGDSHGRCVIWDRAGGQRLQRLDWHTSKITGLRFLPGGEWLVTASDDKTVTRWRVASLLDPAAEPEPDSWILKHPDSVLSISFSADGRLALTAAADGRVRLWDVEQQVEKQTIPFAADNLTMATLSPDGRTALTVHDPQNIVRRWDLTANRELQLADSAGRLRPFLEPSEVGLVWSVAFSSSGRACLTVGGNEARLWDLGRSELPRRAMMTFGPHAAVASANFSPDGRLVVTASWDNSARIWDAENGGVIAKLVGGHSGYVNSAMFSPDGQWVLTSSDDGTAKLWDVETAKVVRSFTGHSGRVHDAHFSEDGQLIVTAASDRTARVWETATGTCIQVLQGHEWGVLSAVFQPGAATVITGSNDNTARIWDVASGQVLRTLSGHTAAVTSVSFSPDGGRALTASADFTAKLWDTSNGKEILNLKGHNEEVTSVSFSRDSRLALTGSRDGTAIVWLAVDWRSES